jgi:biopolymer transport protein ExbD
MRFERAGKPSRRVPLTPLIDVVFLLLIFFMLTSRFLDLGAVGLDAAAAGAETPGLADTIRIDLSGDGRIEIAGASIPREALMTTLRGLLGASAQAPVVVAPDAAVPLETLIPVLDEVRRAGAEQVTLALRAPAPEV